MRKFRNLCHPKSLWEYKTRLVHRIQVLMDQTPIWFELFAGRSGNKGNTKEDLISLEHIATGSTLSNPMMPCSSKGLLKCYQVKRMERQFWHGQCNQHRFQFFLICSQDIGVRLHEFWSCWLSRDEFVFNLCKKQEALRVEGLGTPAASVWS